MSQTENMNKDFIIVFDFFVIILIPLVYPVYLARKIRDWVESPQKLKEKLSRSGLDRTI